MKANELRLGNYVVSNEENCLWQKALYEIDRWTLAKILKYSIKGLEPIPLTEDWLLKFGFEKKYNEYYLGDIIICEEINDFKFGYDFYEDILELKHVHQLQNLYHALTGEELTIKQRR